MVPDNFPSAIAGPNPEQCFFLQLSSYYAGLTCNGVGIQTAAKSENMQLIQLGNLLQEVLAVRPQAGVQHRLSSAQLEVKDAL